MSWFEKLTGFPEAGYQSTQSRMYVDGDRLYSKVNGASYSIGLLEVASLANLRDRCRQSEICSTTTVNEVVADVRKLHNESINKKALFQVASQFNLLEMTGPSVKPEDGVTRYEKDRTQGPACAIAAGAATIYRNYFVPLGSGNGQTEGNQINTLEDFEGSLSMGMSKTTRSILPVFNGYALPTSETLKSIRRYLVDLDESGRDALRSTLKIGIHWDVEVTESGISSGHSVSQAFCSAMPIAYSDHSPEEWHPLASLILEAAYEATLYAGVVNKMRGASNVVFLTFLGAGAFGNPGTWIERAIDRSVNLVRDQGLDIRLVRYR